MKLSKEDAIRLHREMWTAMQKELGDILKWDFGRNPRSLFKERWCNENVPGINVKYDCLLCEYAVRQARKKSDEDYFEDYFEDGTVYCQYCPIDWPHDKECSAYFCECETGVVWSKSPISEILALPEREEDKK